VARRARGHSAPARPLTRRVIPPLDAAGTSPAGDSFDVVPFGVPNPKKPKADGMGSGIPVRARPCPRRPPRLHELRPLPRVRCGQRAVPQGIPKYDPNMILHGEQSLEVLRPLPVEGEFIQKGKVIGVWDKGTQQARTEWGRSVAGAAEEGYRHHRVCRPRGAAGSGMVIENESTVVDAAGTVYVRMVRAARGWAQAAQRAPP